MNPEKIKNTKLRAIKKTLAAFSTICVFAAAIPAHAAIIISEVTPWGSGDSNYAADWFEITNTGTTTVDLAGWKMDDSSNAFGTSVSLRGVASLGAGQSAIFLESNASGTNDAGINNAFIVTWFGANAPEEFLIGNYGGSGVGLSTSGDAVNIFNASGSRVTGVTFGASTSGFSFENAAGINGAISTLSANGINGAFTSVTGNEVGSPGVVPIPAALPLLMSAFGVLGGLRLRRQQK